MSRELYRIDGEVYDAHEIPDINDIKSLNISGFTRIVDHNRVIKKIDIKRSFQQNKSKFIAHGGGEIKGDIYTNSLESLNYNYDLGVRYFELDIFETLVFQSPRPFLRS